MISFGDWKGDIHDDYEQVKRIESAQSKKMRTSIISVDREAGVMHIQGSSLNPYVTTLNECTCIDYSFRYLPCKHIYALAFELGLMDDLPEYDKKKSTFDPKYEVEKYRQLHQDGQISVDTYAKICAAFNATKGKDNPNYDSRPEIDRYKKLYQEGQISADTYVKVCTVLDKLKK
ncbi:MAG: SWIM zinc finger family protein [Muribaculaceae bacterium]|nr:SWIM zinc finger family protein [Muribaculaceae bacterium]